MVHRPADSRLLSNLLQQEKEYSKQLSQLLESSNASLASFTAYAAASSPPGSHVIMSVAGSLAGVDEALKRYSTGVDEWRETMRGLKDAEEEVGNIMRDREILCVFFCLSFFVVSYIRFFPRVTRLIKASNSKKSGAGNIRESLLLNHQRFPSSSSLSLSIGGDSPSPSPSRGFILGPRCCIRSLTISRRPLVWIILVIHEASGCPIRATSLRNAPGS